MPPKKRVNGHKLPEHIPLGEVLEDNSKKKWILGKTIGKGGFGEIYSAKEFDDNKSKEYPYVVKIEPHTNGPLFVEMNFLLRNGKKEDILNFMKERKLKSLGMPSYISSGSHTFNNEKYRFLILERFGDDLLKLYNENKKEIPIVTVFKIALQIIDVLEYLHSKGYVHHDIKGANILLDSKDKNQVYLLDFGLTGRYFTGKVFKREPKKAHDGTLEYISRDGHNGVLTRRSDLEILGYNIIQWLGCNLPWEKLKSPVAVQEMKEKYMNDIPDLMKVCFNDKNPPKTVMEYFIYLTNLDFDTEPDYKKLQKILKNGIDSNGGTLKSPLVFKHSKTPVKRKGSVETPSSGKKPRLPRRKLEVNVENGVENEMESVENEVKIKKFKKDKKKVDLVEESEENDNELEIPSSNRLENKKIKKDKKKVDLDSVQESEKNDEKTEIPSSSRYPRRQRK